MSLLYEGNSEGPDRTGPAVGGQLKKKLFAWQEECLDIWMQHQGRGIVNVVTGAGKTILALGAIARLEKQLLRENAAGLKVIIVVPQVFLLQQWAQTLQDELGIARDQIGIYSGAHKDLPTRKYMIYVVNSARHCLARHLLEDYQRGAAVMLIADECHHYSSPENSRIFDFISHISPGSSSRYYALGLSATPQAPRFDEKLVPALGVQIYKYGFAEALNANIISSFSIFNLKLKFTPDEEQEYLELSEQLSRVLDVLMRRCPYLNGLSSQHFFACLEEMARESDDSALSGLSRAVLILAHQRKDVVYKARARISCVQNLLQRIPAAAKVIIFNERIETAEAIYALLQRLFSGQVGRYHSEMDERSKKRVLRRYSNSEIRILVTCRALDEGLNVPATDVGIIACSTRSSRQRIQRLGRILRRSGENSHACLYYLYIGASNEEQELMADISQELAGLIPVLDLEYDHESQSFLHPSYQLLVDRVLAYARRKAWDAEIVGELERNLERGKLGCEWWFSQQECLRRIQSARSRAERNYWISMRLLAQASRQGLPNG